MTTTHGFELLQEQAVPEINSTARIYRHAKTGARLLSIQNDDENKCFGISFATPPEDSTGLPHILEHSVLCGSRKYPVKEPFVELMKGSLNTFLNAFTYPDKTCYPVASQNLQDFYNLVDVYLDAVFYPRITPHTLQQEGWHYELESLDQPLAFKGVVFNEMKGAYSSPDSLIGRYSQETLFPDNAYGVDSGGDPARIPDLTYEQFKSFHQRCYHPSNSFIFFYGDDDPNERLRILDGYLKDFDAQAGMPPIALQPKFAQPRRFEYGYDAGEGGAEDAGSGKKGFVTVNWLLPESEDTTRTLALSILSHILIGTPASPLRKALIDSGLGEDLIGGGLEEELRQMAFSTGLKGIAVEDAGKVEQLILDTLSAVVRDGIDRDMIEASLNTVEFALRENNTGRFPRGLALMLRSLTTWLYGGDPLAPLAYEAPLAEVKDRYARDARYFEGLVEQLWLANPHRAVVVLKPDPEARRQAEAAERQRLDQARAAMSEADLQAVISNTQELKRLQETPDSPEALAAIPMLKLEDLDRANKTIPVAASQAHEVQLLYHDLFTNGIVYLDLGFNLHRLPQAYLPYAALFGRALLGLGTQAEDYVKLSQRIGRKTGGIRPSTLTAAVRQTSDATAWLFLRGKATMAQSQDLLDLLRDVLLTPRLDNRERFRQIVLEEKAGSESSLVPRGHAVVNSRLRSRLAEADWVGEQIGGVSYLLFLRRLIERIDADWPGVLADLEMVRQSLVSRQAMVCNVTLDQSNLAAFSPGLTAFLAALPASSQPVARWDSAAKPLSEGMIIPAQVNYVAKGANLYQLGYRFDGSALVVAHYLGATWLWEKVRVQGGAYGGFCVFDHRSGVLSYLSYRDPNVLATLDNYDKTSEYLAGMELPADELTKAIIGVIGDLDAYLLPDAKGYTSMVRYLARETDDSRQQMRDDLSTSAGDFKAFADILSQVNRHGLVVVMGSEPAIGAARAQGGLELEMMKVL